MIPQSLGSHYLLVERIGQGSMGVVWRARDLATGNLCAVKLLQPEYAADPAVVARFVRERTALVTFQHPNVVTLQDMIVEGERLGLVMDLVTGGDLAAHRHQRGGRLAAGEAGELTAQICDVSLPRTRLGSCTATLSRPTCSSKTARSGWPTSVSQGSPDIPRSRPAVS